MSKLTVGALNPFESFEAFTSLFDSRFLPPEYDSTVAYKGQTSLGDIFDRTHRPYLDAPHTPPVKYVFDVKTYRETEYRTCAVYGALETIRDTIFSALRDIPKCQTEVGIIVDQHCLFFFKETEETRQRLTESTYVKGHPNIPQEFGVKCKCNKGVPELFWANHIFPTLEKILKELGCAIEETQLPARKIHLFSFRPVYGEGLKSDHIIDAIGIVNETVRGLRIKWNSKFIPGYPLPSPKKLPKISEDPGAFLGEKLLKSYSAGDNLCDIEVISRDGAPLKAHRLILSLASEFLKALVDSPLSESKTGKIKTGYSKDDIKAVLDHIYSGINPFDEKRNINAYQIFIIANI